MEKIVLYMGNRAYSSWSLRAWWTLKMAGVAFEDIVIPLEGAGGSEQRRNSKTLWQYSPSGKVPVLKDRELLVWDSLAIMEYAGERGNAAIWPEAIEDRAVARSIVAEIHGGFPGLGAQIVFNCRRKPVRIRPSADSMRGIDRICRMWIDCRTRFGNDGDFLFGQPTAADAASAPLVSIFHTYEFPVSPVARDYMDAVMSHPAMEDWIAAACAEPWLIEAYESIGQAH